MKTNYKTQFNFEYTMISDNNNLDVLHDFEKLEITIGIDLESMIVYLEAERDGVYVYATCSQYGFDLDIFNVDNVKNAYEVFEPETKYTDESLCELRQFMKIDFMETWDEFYMENELGDNVYESYPFEYQYFVDLMDDKIQEFLGL